MRHSFVKIIFFFIALHFLSTQIWANPQPQLSMACEASARKALGRINKVPMEKRAPRVWRELSQTEIYCDHADSDLMQMAQKASRFTGVKREWELGVALQNSSHFKKTCPSGPKTYDSARHRTPRDQIEYLVTNCPIQKPLGYGAKKDLGAMTFLFVQAVLNHWKNHGVRDDSHQIILNTLLLASAHERGVIDDLIDQLSHPAPLARNREDIEQEIKKQGLDAIPILINRLDDRTPAGDTTAAPPGRCLNLPPLGSEELPDECRNLKTEQQTTIGQRCNKLLYAIITPPRDLTLEQGRILWKTQIDRSFVIKDWILWWGENQGLSLEKIRAKAGKLENQFWNRGWEKGPVEWK